MATEILGILVPPIVEIAKCLFAPVGEKLGHILHYQENIKNLQDQVEELKSTKDSVEKAVEEALQRNEILNFGVSEWLKKVEVVESEAKITLERSLPESSSVNRSSCFSGGYLSCPNLSLRYKLSKEAVTMAGVVRGLQSDGKFNSISYTNPVVASASSRPERPPPSIELLMAGHFEAFESTRTAMLQVMSGLEDQSTYVIGVYGMGGIGKTTLVKEIGKRVKVGKTFEEVLIATVSQNPDLKRIQGEIAEGLGERLREETVSVRALRLTSWLKQKKRVLIILDDLWDRVELGELGIPYGAYHSGCKVVLTTRSLDVCNLMDSRMNVQVKVLSDQDSWNLFRNVAGNVVESYELHSVAKEVVQECGGLPIALVTLGRALRNRQASVWYNAVRELRISKPTTIRGMSEKVFSCIKLSFDYLQSEEAKLCFLYFSMFPEDYDVNIEDLVRYGFGEGLFSNEENLGDWRNKAHVIVDDLISCCLLLKGKKKGYARMHDVVRDVAISISNEEQGFMVKARTGLKELPKRGRLEQFTRMSLMNNEIKKISGTVECPNLKVLLLQNNASLWNIADDFFSGMDSLEVLDISYIRILVLPNSLPRLTKLKTLQLDNIQIRGIAIIGELRELEILSLQSSSFEEIPEELKNLARLKLLDLTDSEVESFPKNILSSLSQLEELYMARSFSQWEVEDSESKGQANLSEFSSLENLTALQIDITNYRCLFKDTLGCWQNLQNFLINVGNYVPYMRKKDARAMCLRYTGRVSNLRNAAEWTKGLMKKTKNLSLTTGSSESIDKLSANGLTESLEALSFKDCSITAACTCKLLKELHCLESLSLIHCLKLKAVFLDSEDDKPETNTLPSLKKLHLKDLYDLECVIKGCSPSPPLCFSYLQSLTVECCLSMTSLFRPELAETLQQLAYLKIQECPLLRSIISYSLDLESIPSSHRLLQEDKVITFPKLTYISLSSLRSFNYFSEPPVEVSFPSLKELHVTACRYASSFTEQYKSVVYSVM